MKIYQLAALAALVLATATGSALAAPTQSPIDHDRCVNAINSNNASDVRAFCPKSEWLVDQ